ncbi:MAG: hypothetical protein U1F43_19060 [Myxococcota bacterium]
MHANATADASSFFAAHDLSGAALFQYFDAIRRGKSREEAERAAIAADQPTVPVRFIDVAPASPADLPRVRAIVAYWLAHHPNAGTSLLADGNVCLEVRERFADGVPAELRHIARDLGAPTAIGRIDSAGPTGERAFDARRRPTLILRTGSATQPCR